jgi:hypothetical protein
MPELQVQLTGASCAEMASPFRARPLCRVVFVPARSGGVSHSRSGSPSKGLSGHTSLTGCADPGLPGQI